MAGSRQLGGAGGAEARRSKAARAPGLRAGDRRDGSGIGRLRSVVESLVRLPQHPVVVRLELGRGDPAAGPVKPAVVPPLDPTGGGELDLVNRPPGAPAADQLGLVQAVDRLRQRVQPSRQLRRMEALRSELFG